MIQPLVSPDVLEAFLASNALKADKSLGQNFLICEEVIDAILMGLKDGPKRLTELGPGVGTLTQGLISAGYTVKAIEKDDDFVKTLPSVIPPKLRSNLTVIHGDLKEVDWTHNEPYSIVGNIPYNLSGLIIRRLTNLQATPHCAIFLMQKEVADRVVAQDSDMSLLGLSVGLWGKAHLLLNVPSSCFMPAPKVQSALVLIQQNPNPLPVEKREEIIAKAKPFFQAKRKQIGTTLKRAYNKSSEDIESLTTSLGIPPTIRPENISTQDWIKLCDIL